MSDASLAILTQSSMLLLSIYDLYYEWWNEEMRVLVCTLIDTIWMYC